MAVMGSFFGLDAATLASLKAKYVAALEAIATRGQSYTLDGRTLTAANLNDIRQTIAEIIAAQQYAAGTRRTASYARFRTGY